MPSPRQTPSQTVGPFFGVGLTRPSQSQHVLVSERTDGERIRIEGRVLDGVGSPIEDALVEIWQANAHGRYRHPLDTGPAPLDPAFFGFGRCPTDAHGTFRFDTVKPGSIPGRERNRARAAHQRHGVRARHARARVHTDVFRRRRARRGSGAGAGRQRPAAYARRRTHPTNGGLVVYRWDIRLQGERETVFFDA